MATSTARVFDQEMTATRLSAFYQPLIGFLPQIGLACVLSMTGFIQYAGVFAEHESRELALEDKVEHLRDKQFHTPKTDTKAQAALKPLDASHDGRRVQAELIRRLAETAELDAAQKDPNVIPVPAESAGGRKLLVLRFRTTPLHWCGHTCPPAWLHSVEQQTVNRIGGRAQLICGDIVHVAW